MIKTLVSDALRKRLSEDSSLGAGNFLSHAMTVSPDVDADILYLEKAMATPDGPVYALSLRHLESLTQTYAAWFWNAGVRNQDLVAIYLDDGIEYLLHYLALVRLGAIPVLINGNMPAEIALPYALKVGCMGFVLDAAHRALLYGMDLSGFRFVYDGNDLPSSWEVWRRPYRHVDGDPVMIAHSSGTTGIPKAVLLEHDKFFFGVRHRLSLPRVPGGERILSSLPHSHNCAVAYIMLALLSGTPVFIGSDHSGLAVIKHIEQFRPSMVVSFPQTYVEITEQDLDQYDLSSVELWFNGGDAAHETHIRKLIAQGTYRQDGKVTKGSIFIDGMGSSEMGFSLFRHVHTPNTDQYNRCVGRPLPWVDAAILSDEGDKLSAGVVGRLGVKAPSVTTGYWNDSFLTYKSRLAGYFLTGDLAYRDREGKIYHVDRVPDAIYLDRATIYTLLTEEILMSRCQTISDCSVVPVQQGSRPIKAKVLVRLRNQRSADPAEMRDEFNRVLEAADLPTIDLVEFVDAGQVPLGTTGKVLKRVIRSQENARGTV